MQSTTNPFQLRAAESSSTIFSASGTTPVQRERTTGDVELPPAKRTSHVLATTVPCKLCEADARISQGRQDQKYYAWCAACDKYAGGKWDEPPYIDAKTGALVIPKEIDWRTGGGGGGKSTGALTTRLDSMQHQIQALTQRVYELEMLAQQTPR